MLTLRQRPAGPRRGSCLPLVEVPAHRRGLGRREPRRLPAETVEREVGACWAFVDRQVPPVHVRPLSASTSTGASISPARSLFVGCWSRCSIPRVPCKRSNALLFFVVFPIVALLPAGRRRVRPGACRDPAVGRPAGHAGGLVRRHRRLAAARHPAGARPALAMPIVRTLSSSSSSRARRAADHRAVHGTSCCRCSCRPAGQIDKLLRALIGVALFSAAYMAEVVRGGLQAIPTRPVRGARGARPRLLAEDAADHPAAGAEARHPRHRQHLHLAVQGHDPGLIIGMFDLLGHIRAAFADPNWASPTTPFTGYRFAGDVCSGSSASACRATRMCMERRLEHRPPTLSERAARGHDRKRLDGRPSADALDMPHDATRSPIEIVDMNKWYGDFHVLRDINLKVMRASASSSAGRRAPASRR